jgi:hypothetical protein
VRGSSGGHSLECDPMASTWALLSSVVGVMSGAQTAAPVSGGFSRSG